jgi:hypothetical protein
VLRKKIKHLTRRNGFIPTALIRLRLMSRLAGARDTRRTVRPMLSRSTSQIVKELLPIIGRTTQRWPNPTILSHALEKCFSAEGVKLGGVPKKRFQCTNHYQPSINNNYLTFCFCAAGKEIGGVPKIKFGVRNAESNTKRSWRPCEQVLENTA